MSDDVQNEDEITIAEMNVEGMPWYSPKRASRPETDPAFTKKEWRYIYQGALKAAGIVAIAASVFIILFVAFCVHVWFK